MIDPTVLTAVVGVIATAIGSFVSARVAIRKIHITKEDKIFERVEAHIERLEDEIEGLRARLEKLSQELAKTEAKLRQCISERHRLELELNRG